MPLRPYDLAGTLQQPVRRYCWITSMKDCLIRISFPQRRDSRHTSRLGLLKTNFHSLREKHRAHIKQTRTCNARQLFQVQWHILTIVATRWISSMFSLQLSHMPISQVGGSQRDLIGTGDCIFKYLVKILQCYNYTSQFSHILTRH